MTDGSGTLRFAVGTTARGFVGFNVRDGTGTICSNLDATDDGAATDFQTWAAQPRPVRHGRDHPDGQKCP